MYTSSVSQISSLDNISFYTPPGVLREDYIEFIKEWQIVPWFIKGTKNRVFVLTEKSPKFDPLSDYIFPIFLIKEKDLNTWDN